MTTGIKRTSAGKGLGRLIRNAGAFVIYEFKVCFV